MLVIITLHACYCSTQLSLQIKELEAQRSTLENQVTSLRAQLQTDADHWKKQLRLAEEEKERLLKDKDALLEEVNVYSKLATALCSQNTVVRKYLDIF